MAMKKIIIIISAALAFLCTGISANAFQRWEDDWKEKMKSEKIAFLTLEVGLTPEEAQVFWPVYNQVEKEKDEALMNVLKTYKDLLKATEEGKPAKEIGNALDKYIEAQQKLREIENGVAEKYKSALSVEKVAKLYVAEEKFRRNHIRNMKGNQPAPKK